MPRALRLIFALVALLVFLALLRTCASLERGEQAVGAVDEPEERGLRLTPR